MKTVSQIATYPVHQFPSRTFRLERFCFLCLEKEDRVFIGTFLLTKKGIVQSIFLIIHPYPESWKVNLYHCLLFQEKFQMRKDFTCLPFALPGKRQLCSKYSLAQKTHHSQPQSTPKHSLVFPSASTHSPYEPRCQVLPSNPYHGHKLKQV